MSEQAAAAAATVPLWFQALLAVFGGGLTGTLITTYLAAGREGRSARAKVRECLAATEDLRWTDADYREFRKAVSGLESAALIARVDPGLIDRYVYIATVAHYTEVQERDRLPGYPLRTLPAELANLVEYTLLQVIRQLWRPRFFRRTKLAKWRIDSVTKSALRRNPGWAWRSPMINPLRLAKAPGPMAWLLRRAPAIDRRLRERSLRQYTERAARTLPGGFLDDGPGGS